LGPSHIGCLTHWVSHTLGPSHIGATKADWMMSFVGRSGWVVLYGRLWSFWTICNSQDHGRCDDHDCGVIHHAIVSWAP